MTTLKTEGYLTEEELSSVVNEASGTQKFVRLVNKPMLHGELKSIEGVFVGNGYGFYKYWDDSAKRSVMGTRDGIAKIGQKPSYAAMRNFATLDGEIKIFEQGKSFWKKVDNFLKTDMTAEEPLAIKITRMGEGRDTVYEISLAQEKLENGLKRDVPAAEVLNNIDETQLHDLEEIVLPQIAAFNASEGVTNILGGQVTSTTSPF